MFEKILQNTLKWENNFTDYPMELGGPRNRGISLKDYCKHISQNANKNTIESLTAMEIEEYYLQKYWLVIDFYELDFSIAAKYFDLCVSLGVSEATRVMQKALKMNPTGICCYHTMQTLKEADEKDLLQNIIKETKAHYFKHLNYCFINNLSVGALLRRAEHII